MLNCNKIIEDLEAVVEGRAGDAVLEREVDGVKLKYIPMDQLLQLLERFYAIRAQQSGGGLPLPGHAVLSFRG